ncbi:hypothetical protein GOP47_0006011 [Adiantum capillus-veneris]|uniref:Uncharacterized protein n=1 Tax=Adiantum capillus-veneris TaxID=13818 RepID=A0A9D4ZMM8_ADICA|nr:hypothetical protein GOP47_0006011 [Adiantum capillus-veneris]
MPNEPGPSLFLVVCSIISNQNTGTTPATCKTREDLLAELKYWLRYISSSTRQNSPSGKPSAIFIFTHLDKLETHQQEAMMARAKDLTDEVQRDFNLIADKQDTMFFLDSRNNNDVSKVVTTILSESERIRSSCEDIHKMCDDAKKLIAEQLRRYPDEAWVPQSTLELLIDEKVVMGPVTRTMTTSKAIKDITKVGYSRKPHKFRRA